MRSMPRRCRRTTCRLAGRIFCGWPRSGSICWRINARRLKTMKTDVPVIEIKNLVRRYGQSDAVNGLNLRVMPGKCYGFFGRNGAGKTTTIKCLLNLLRPTSGEVRVFGMDPAKEEVG